MFDNINLWNVGLGAAFTALLPFYIRMVARHISEVYFDAKFDYTMKLIGKETKHHGS